MGRPRGMTLMEVLIAVSLVALLSTGMLFALRAGIGSVESINRHVQTVRKASGAQRILEQQFASLMPVAAPCRVPNVPDSQTRSAFFDGEPNVIRFVSAYSLQEAGRGHPQILELFAIPAEDGNGVRLVVNETLYQSPLTAGMMCMLQSGESPDAVPMLLFPPPKASPQSFVLADRLARVRFAYQELSRSEPYESWLPRWIRTDAFPSAVRIDMVPLAEDASGLPPLPFFARIQVNRRIGESTEF
jgi:prepilin-type N-terminal cleavage/methylation domain-containing protein